MSEPQEVQVQTMDDAQLEESIQQGLLDEGKTVTQPEAPEPEESTTPTEQPAEPPPPSLEERLARLETQLQEKEKFIARQGNEIGLLRKQVSRPQIDIAKAREEIREQFQTDPAKALNNAQALNRYIAEVQRDRAVGVVPDLPDIMDEICEIAKAEGESDKTLEAFRADPYRVPEHILYDYAVRARAYKYAKGKSSEAESLRKQLEELRGRAAEQVAARIDQAAKAQPVIRASSGGGTSSVKDASSHSRLTESQIPNLSYEQITELLAKRRG